MGMSTGGSKGGAVPSINVTPLIDVLLVLLIIFMVITPLKPSRFEAKVPAEPKPEDQTIAKPNPNTLVVAINRSNMGLTLNNEPYGNVTEPEALTNKLKAVFKERQDKRILREGTNEVEKTLFIKSPRSVKYGDVVKVIDAVKEAGAQPIGLQIDDLAQ